MVVPAGLAVLGGFIYLLWRRSNKTPRNLDNTQEFDTDQNHVHHTFEVADNSRPHELSEQSLVELSGQNRVELQHVASPRVSGGCKDKKTTLRVVG